MFNHAHLCVMLSYLWIAVASSLAQTPAHNTVQTSSPTPARTAGPGAKGSYYPLAVGNWWSYTTEDYSGKKVKKSGFKWEVAQKEVIKGATVYYLWLTPPLDDEPLILSPRKDGIVEPPFQPEDPPWVLLKNSLHAGERWSSGPRGKADTLEVISVGQPCVVGEKSFDDCAIIREVYEKGDATVISYARGVGPVARTYFKSIRSKKIESKNIIRSWHVH